MRLQQERLRVMTHGLNWAGFWSNPTRELRSVAQKEIQNLNQDLHIAGSPENTKKNYIAYGFGKYESYEPHESYLREW